MNVGDIISALASSQYKLNSAPLTVCFPQSFTKFPMKPPRSLHFQYDFTIKITYSNIKRYTKRGKKLIACALYLIATLFCKQCWQYCHYIWDFREMKKNTYRWLQVKSVSLKMSGYAAQRHRQLLWIKLYSERSHKARKLTEIHAKLLGWQYSLFFYWRWQKKRLDGGFKSVQFIYWTVSCVSMSTAGDSIPVHHVPFLAPGSFKPTSIHLHCLWINAMDWLENRWLN